MPIPLGILAAAGVRAAGGSYELIETITVGSGGAASVTFSNLNTYSSTYQHLQIRGVARSNRATFTVDSLNMLVNGSSMTAYHRLYGNGSSVQSNIDATIAEISTNVSASGIFGAFVIDILDPYETKNKTIRALSGTWSDDAGGFSGKTIQLASTFINATTSVSSITLDPTFGSQLVQGSRFSIYGLKAS